MLHSWCQLSQNDAPRISHLRAMNPYVSGSLSSRSAVVYVPRQASTAPVLEFCPSEHHSGVSSFAFQVMHGGA